MAILWESCGPYHFARLETLRRISGEDTVIALELSPKNSTYAWRVENREINKVISLFPECSVEEVRLLPLFKRLRTIFRKENIDVFFTPSYWPAYSLVAALAAKSLGIRIVFMGDSHYASGSNQGLAIIIKRLLIRLYDSALVAGSLHRSFLRHLGMPAEKIFDGYDTIDNDFFANTAETARAADSLSRRQLHLPPRYFLSLGRFVPKKNLETIIKAYAKLVQDNKHAGHDLVFVGSGQMHGRLVDLARELGLGVVDHRAAIQPLTTVIDNSVTPGVAVHFHPFAQIESVPAYYALATAFLLASTSDEWGLVVNEAMACSCPVIVSRSVGSSLDLVIPQVTGYRFVSENVHELTWCMENICGDLDEARRFGRQAHAHIAAWSNVRFARNAEAAARAALSPLNKNEYAGKIKSHSANNETIVDSRLKQTSSAPTVWFLQTCFPDYRMPVFHRLHERLGDNFHLFSGTSFFTSDIIMTLDFMDWHSLVDNRFLAGRRFLWQTGACEAMFSADVLVMELNPRILSNWVILAARSLWGAPTLLWGHAWGRHDQHSVRNVLRLYMMRLASGTITYTKTQRDEVRRVFPRFKMFAATNSLIRQIECRPLSIKEGELDTILYVGRLNRPKKVALLLEAFAQARLPTVTKLKIVGSGQEREALEAMLKTMPHIADRVEFVGHVHSFAILRSLYARGFCAVSPGYVGLGAIQTFSFGVPLVLADKEPHAPEVEACRPGFNTLYFEANNATSLSTCMERMWHERAVWLGRRAELAAWTAENYSVEAMVDGFIEAINAVSIRPHKATGLKTTVSPTL